EMRTALEKAKESLATERPTETGMPTSPNIGLDATVIGTVEGGSRSRLLPLIAAGAVLVIIIIGLALLSSRPPSVPASPTLPPTAIAAVATAAATFPPTAVSTATTSTGAPTNPPGTATESGGPIVATAKTEAAALSSSQPGGTADPALVAQVVKM